MNAGNPVCPPNALQPVWPKVGPWVPVATCPGQAAEVRRATRSDNNRSEKTGEVIQPHAWPRETNLHSPGAANKERHWLCYRFHRKYIYVQPRPTNSSCHKATPTFRYYYSKVYEHLTIGQQTGTSVGGSPFSLFNFLTLFAIGQPNTRCTNKICPSRIWLGYRNPRLSGLTVLSVKKEIASLPYLSPASKTASPIKITVPRSEMTHLLPLGSRAPLVFYICNSLVLSCVFRVEE